MSNNTKTKRSLFASILSMVLCISMLLGTTLAWFTDTAVNTNNRVKAGTLDVKLLKFNGTEYVDISNGSGNIFNDGTVKEDEAEVKNVAKATLWEPNKTEVVLLQVKNDGDLALDYNILLEITSSDDDVQLEKVMNYAIISGINAEDYKEANVQNWNDILKIEGVETGILPSGRIVAAPNGSLLKDGSDYFALAVHMDAEAGNEYQNLTIDIDVNVEAQQKVYESDSFGNGYDLDWRAKLAAEDAVSQYKPTGGWLEPLIPGENLLTNGDFSDGLNGWQPFGGNETYRDAVSLTEGYKGGEDQAMRMVRTTTSGQNILWSQEIAVTEADWGDEYQLSYYYKMDDAKSTTQSLVTIYCWGETRDTAGMLKQVTVGPNKNWVDDGEWHLAYGDFIIPEGTRTVEFVPRIVKAGGSTYVDYDELILYKTCVDGSAVLPYGSNGTFSLDTDGTIFYTDLDTTTFSISMSDAAQSNAEYTDATVKFEVYDGADVIWGPQTASFTEGVASVNFDLSNMVKINAPYCVKATVSDAAGSELWVVTKELFMFERPWALDENGNYVKFGKNFNPIIGYHMLSNEDILKAKEEAGVNVIQLAYQTNAEAVLAQLDNCAALGVKGIVCLYYNMLPAAADRNLDYTIDIVSDPRIRNHEALFGYKTQDEPFHVIGEPARELLIESYRLIRQYDQKNIIFHSENLQEKFHESAELADVIMPDVYVKAEGAGVYTEISDAVKASTMAGKPKSLWALLMSFDYKSKLGYWVYEDDIRNNNWQALIAGADMFGYFSISDAGGTVTIDGNKVRIPVWNMPYGEDTTAGARIWDSMCEFNNVEKEIAYDHFIRKEGTKLIEDINIENGGYIAYSWADKDGQVYVVLLNVKGDENTVSVALKNADGSAMSNYTATVIAGRDTATETVSYTRTDGTLSVDMTGVEALLFTVTAN